MVAKKKAVKKKLVKKAVVKKAVVKKAVVKKEAVKPAPKKTVVKKVVPKKATPPEPTPDVEEAAPPVQRRRKKATPIEADNDAFLGQGEINFAVSEALRVRFLAIHESTDHREVLRTLTTIFEAGLGALEGIPSVGSANLLDEDADEVDPYGDEFDQAFSSRIESLALAQL